MKVTQMPSQRRGMTTPNKIALAFLLVSVLALVGFVVLNNQNNAAEQKDPATSS